MRQFNVFLQSENLYIVQKLSVPVPFEKILISPTYLIFIQCKICHFSVISFPGMQTSKEILKQENTQLHHSFDNRMNWRLS